MDEMTPVFNLPGTLFWTLKLGLDLGAQNRGLPPSQRTLAQRLLTELCVWEAWGHGTSQQTWWGGGTSAMMERGQVLPEPRAGGTVFGEEEAHGGPSECPGRRYEGTPSPAEGRSKPERNKKQDSGEAAPRVVLVVGCGAFFQAVTSGGCPEQQHPGGQGRYNTQHPRTPLSQVLESPHAWVWGGEVG